MLRSDREELHRWFFWATHSHLAPPPSAGWPCGIGEKSLRKRHRYPTILCDLRIVNRELAALPIHRLLRAGSRHWATTLDYEQPSSMARRSSSIPLDEREGLRRRDAT
jgi:hypothetical protein